VCTKNLRTVSKFDAFIVASTQDAPFGTSIYFLSTWPSEAKKLSIGFRTKEYKLDQNCKSNTKNDLNAHRFLETFSF